MARVVITIHPEPSDEGLLRVADAMQQVIDAINVLVQAERALISPDEWFEWRLKRAATESPFTVEAVAEPLNPTIDIAPQVQRVKTEVSSGLRNFITRGERPSWMGAEGLKTARNFFVRTQNGIGRTDIDFEIEGNGHDVVSIDRAGAEAGIRAIAALNLLDIEAELPERMAFGEIEGAMIAAGRYRRNPAITILTELYGFVWCTLTESVIEKFGAEHTMADLWRGKTVAVLGRLYYAAGKLQRAEAVDVREIGPAPPINLQAVLDSNFTSGMDPNEYLDKLHAGELG